MKIQTIVLLIIISSLFFTGIVSAGQETGTLFVWGDNSFGQCTNVPAGNDFAATAAGMYHTVALRENGSIVAWGDNMYGQCNAPAGNEYTAIAAGGMNSMALRQDGSIVAWGDNSYGQCNVPAGNDFMAIAVGGSEFCVALRNNGSIVAWGNNGYGQCNVPAGNNFTAISAGTDFAMALRQDGSIAAWGLNQFGQCSVPSEKDFSAVSAGWSSALALRTNGTVIGWGMNNANQCNPPPGNEYRQIATGDQFSCALWQNNSIITWGANWNGLTQPPLGDDYFSLGAGEYHAVALHSPLWVNASVSGGHGTADPPNQTAKFLSGVNVTFTPDPGYYISSITDNGVEQEIENPYSISGIRGDHQVVVFFAAIPSEYSVNAAVIGGHGTVAPSQQTVGIHENATISLNPDPGYSIGAIFDNGISQQVQDPYIINDVENTHDVVVIFITHLPGSLSAWGYNDQGSCDVPAGDNYTAIASGWGSSLASRNGTLLDWGDNQYGQHDVPAGDDYLALSSGYFHNLALQQDGSIAAWGNNQYGQCNVPAGITYAAVSAGGWHSLAIATNGSIVAWGESMGEAPAGNDFAAIASGWYHNLALRQDGSVVAWGNNIAGQCNVPAGNDYIAISGGGYHSLALRQNGSIVAWGDNQYGQCNVPAGNDYVAVSGGGYFSLALRQNGSIVAWGANDSGECDAPDGIFSTIAGGYEHSLAIAPASGAPVAGFSATPKSGISPLPVQFNDTSTGTPPLSYQWNFGDGTPNVTVQNPVHTYITGSNQTFTAVLTVENSEGTDSTAGEIQVNVTATDPSGIRWNITTVDPNSGKSTSIGVDAAGLPQICYIDPVRGALLYALHDGIGWHIETVDDNVPGDQSTSLAIDSGGDPHIAYTDMERGYIKYATQWDHTNVEQVSPECISLALNSAGEAYIAYGVTSDSDINHPPGLFWVTNHGGGWNTFEIDSTANPTWCSIAVDSKRNGFHIGYYDANNIPDPYNIGVKYAWADSGGWHTTTVDQTGLNWFGSLAIDSGGNPRMAYADGAGALKYAWLDASGWHTTVVDKNPMYVSLAIDAADNPHIAYSDAGGTLKYAWSNASGWHTTTVDSAAFPGVGYFCSIAVDAAGHPHISYYDWSNDALKYAYGTIGGSNGQESEMSGWVSSGSDYGPLYIPGIRVRVARSAGDLSIPGKYWEAVTNDQGIYTLTGLPSGVPLYAAALSPVNRSDTYYERPVQYQVNAGRLITCMNRTSTPLIPPLEPGARAQVNWVLTRNPGNQQFLL